MQNIKSHLRTDKFYCLASNFFEKIITLFLTVSQYSLPLYRERFQVFLVL